MAREKPIYHDRIIQDPEIMVGQPVIKGNRIPVELVLEHLAHNPDLEDLFGTFPELTREDVRAVMAYARDRIRSDGGSAAPTLPSPQDFYAEVTKREDVSEILRRLAQ